MAISKDSYAIVFVTTASEEEAAAIGRALVEERLAACANLVGPIRSIYRWREAVEDASEHLLLIKTRASLFAALQARVKQLHSYEVPEIIAVEIKQGSPQYLDWIGESTAQTRAKLAGRSGAVQPRRSRAGG
ncbi:MAG TPA: divalent-cation tolerance protein CutA [Candidatus Binataceae bacterium]|jgi:periplasmic divalent cation tolerance protein|nr:divalent-cation tolerance protein CutA [Candidatus Binataceae bacterium]